jgi:hypothetical protein
VRALALALWRRDTVRGVCFVCSSCGSGAALTHLGLLLRARDVACVLLATDVNPVATRTTLRTSRHNDVSGLALRTMDAYVRSCRKSSAYSVTWCCL